jgi:uncharacterized protein YdhG (YjbR/CyaY superfamily)
MQTTPKPATTVDAYIAQFEPLMQERLNELRQLIQSVLPNAIEDISYGMPAYRAQPKKRPIVFFGMAKNHIGLYALSEKLSPELQERVAPHVTGRGTLQFAHSLPLPLQLIEEILLETKKLTVSNTLFAPLDEA